MSFDIEAWKKQGQDRIDEIDELVRELEAKIRMKELEIEELQAEKSLIMSSMGMEPKKRRHVWMVKPVIQRLEHGTVGTFEAVYEYVERELKGVPESSVERCLERMRKAGEVSLSGDGIYFLLGPEKSTPPAK